MLFEILSTSMMAATTAWATVHVKGGLNDGKKIARICNNAGLTVKENGQKQSMQLLRKRKHEWGTEYIYRIPLGLAFSDFEKKREAIEDGLNSKSYIDVKTFLKELSGLKLNRKIFDQIKQLLKERKGEKKIIDLSYDGVLKVKVYDADLPTDFRYTEELFNQVKGWEIPVGTTLTKLIKHDFDKHPHLVVAGSTGYGKSVFMKSLITTLVAKQTKNVHMYLVDLKGGLAFNRFRRLEQVKSLAKNPSEAFVTLQQAQEKMESIMNHLLLNEYEDVNEANIPERYFVIIDEAADISDDKASQEIIKDISRRGRAAGFRLIYATQYPTNETLPSQVRQNISAQVCFRLKTAIASRAVMDEDGAEKLPLIKGRAIYNTDRKIIVQTPYIDNKFIDESIKPNIIIRGRKEGMDHEKGHRERETARKHTLLIEEIGVR